MRLRSLFWVSWVGFAGVALVACGNWKIGLPGADSKGGSGAGSRSEQARARYCQKAQVDSELDVGSYATLHEWVIELLPQLERDRRVLAHADALYDVVETMMRLRSEIRKSPVEMAERARAMALRLPGEPAEVLLDVMQRYQLAEDDACTAFALGKLATGFIRQLDPFGELLFPEPRRSSLVSRRRISGGWLLPPAQNGAAPATGIVQPVDGPSLVWTVRRWEDDAVEVLGSLSQNLSSRAQDLWVFDIRSAAGLSVPFLEQMERLTQERIAAGKGVLIWTDRFTRGAPELWAQRMAETSPLVLTMGEITQGYLRTPCEKEGVLSGESGLVQLRIGCQLLTEDSAPLDRIGFVPEIITRVDEDALGWVPRSSLRKLLEKIADARAEGHGQGIARWREDATRRQQVLQLKMWIDGPGSAFSGREFLRELGRQWLLR